MTPTDRSARAAQRWVVPLVALAFGLAYLVAGVVGDDVGFGVVGLLVMTAVAAGTVVLARSSETVAGLLDRRDERINRIDLEATAFAGMTVLAVVLGAFVVEIARGQDGSPWSALGAVGGLAYVAALAVLRRRR